MRQLNDYEIKFVSGGSRIRRLKEGVEIAGAALGGLVVGLIHGRFSRK